MERWQSLILVAAFGELSICVRAFSNKLICFASSAISASESLSSTARLAAVLMCG